MIAKVELLTNILLDRTASLIERDDAAEYLAQFDDDVGLNALVAICQNPTSADEYILDTCGEAIGEIWLRKNCFDPSIYSKLHHIAKGALRNFILENNPKWTKFF